MMNKIKIERILISLFLLIILTNCGNKETAKTPFKLLETDEKVELLENDKLVFAYQKGVKSLDGKFARNNYIHPLMSLEGDTLTEDFPNDHPHQRGIFWAWHQIFIDTLHVSDSWALKNFNSELISIKTFEAEDSAVIKANLQWRSPIYKKGTPYLSEETTITTHKLNNGLRKIDIKIALNALVPNLSIGGADNEKGYGGFSLRIKMPDSLKFYSKVGRVKPKRTQITVGAWMKFVAPFGVNKKEQSITVKTDVSSPNYPQPWILRQKKSMQNVVFPGRELYKLTLSRQLVLNYSIIIKNEK